jgi:hypothetical protein
MAFFWSLRRSYSACSSAAVIPAKEEVRAFRRASRVSECILARDLGPMPGNSSQWPSGIPATSRIEGQRPPNSARIACLTRGGSFSSGRRSYSRIGIPKAMVRDTKMLLLCGASKRHSGDDARDLAPKEHNTVPDERSPITYHLVLPWCDREQGIRRLCNLTIERDLSTRSRNW